MLRAMTALSLLAASTPAGFTPGLWEIVSAPTGASLDGRSLDDLPYRGRTRPATICLSPGQANDARWLTRDFAPGCAVTRQSLANGRIDIAATCPPQAPDLAQGTVRLTGRWTSTSYAVRFVTTNPSENGVMGFTGKMTGRVVGRCPTLSSPVTPGPPR